MKKVIIGIAMGILIGMTFYFTSTFFCSYEFISKDNASVTIINESGQQIKTVRLKHHLGTLEANNLNDKDQVRFIFTNRGENSYQVIVTFRNDSTMTSQEVYIEYGYRGAETITKTEIKTKNNW